MQTIQDSSSSLDIKPIIDSLTGVEPSGSQTSKTSKKKPSTSKLKASAKKKPKKLKKVQPRKRKLRDSLSVLYNINGFQVPVFTDQFLEQNKAVENELRRLRKVNNDQDEHNSLLSKHIDNLQLAVAQLKNEAKRLQAFNHDLAKKMQEHYHSSTNNGQL